MIDINELRRLAQAVQAVPDSPRNIHERVNALHDLHDALLSGVVLEILDRLEAAETELAELRSSMKFRTSLIGRTEAERDTLRAKITEMEKQEPVAWMSSRNGFICKENKNPDYNIPLCALPGAQAQPAPSVSDDGFKRAVMEIKDIGYGAIFKHLICERAAELAAAPKPEAKP